MRSKINGGRTRTRTLDPLIKSQLLYQLSYAPQPRSGRSGTSTAQCIEDIAVANPSAKRSLG